MKKLVLILAFILPTVTMTAQNGGLFGRGNEEKTKINFSHNHRAIPLIPGHGETGDQPAPVGAGTALLIGFGAAYAMYKKKSNK